MDTDLDTERCGPVTLVGELRFRHEHDLHNTPGYRESLLCRRTERALAQAAQPEALPVEAYATLAYVETIERVETIKAASTRAKAVLARPQAVAHHLDESTSAVDGPATSIMPKNWKQKTAELIFNFGMACFSDAKHGSSRHEAAKGALESHLTALTTALEAMVGQKPLVYAVPKRDGSVQFGKGWMFSPVPQKEATMPLYGNPVTTLKHDALVHDAALEKAAAFVANSGALKTRHDVAMAIRDFKTAGGDHAL